MIIVHLNNELIHFSQKRNAGIRRVAKGWGGGGGIPPARPKQIQFALNRKHAFFDDIS